MTLVSNLKNKIQEQTHLEVLYCDIAKTTLIRAAPLKTLVTKCGTRKARGHKKHQVEEERKGAFKDLCTCCIFLRDLNEFGSLNGLSRALRVL